MPSASEPLSTRRTIWWSWHPESMSVSHPPNAHISSWLTYDLAHSFRYPCFSTRGSAGAFRHTFLSPVRRGAIPLDFAVPFDRGDGQFHCRTITVLSPRASNIRSKYPVSATFGLPVLPAYPIGFLIFGLAFGRCPESPIE